MRPDGRGPPTALGELSAATSQYAGRVGQARPPQRRSSVILPIMAALILGTLLTFSEPFEYLCGVTVRIAGSQGSAQLAAHRAGLLDYAWQFTAVGTEPSEFPAQWFVETPGEDLMRLCLTTPDAKAGTQRLQQIAQSYIADVTDRADKSRTVLTEAETVLSEYAAELHTRLNETQAQVERSMESLPSSDPRERRGALLGRWQALRTKFIQSREQLRSASAALARLEAEPEPTHGIVSREDRDEALGADDALQQDLRELEVNLTEMKLHLLNVWQECSADLEHVSVAAGDLLDTFGQLRDGSGSRSHPRDRAAGFSPRERSQPMRPGSESDAGAGAGPEGVARRYAELLETFSEAWNKDFALLRRLELDPLSGDILAIHQRLRSSLSGFLFTASKYLSALRANVLTLGEGAEDRARLHVFESAAMRSFQAVQNAHRRFEFAAGGIETRDNFRLDTASRSARGLRRRSQRRIQSIDERLLEEARKRAREERTQSLADARGVVEGLRPAAIDVVEELVILQEELNLSAGLTEEFLRSTLQVEFAGHLTEAARGDLGQTEKRLLDLAERRTSTSEDVMLELVDCGVIAGPVNLGERLRIGALGALMTFLVVGLGQWWLNRRA